MLVKLPSFSVCAAAGRKNTSVLDVLRAHLAGLVLGRVLPERGRLGRAGSRARRASRAWPAPSRISFELAEPTAGFCPTQNMPLHAAVEHLQHHRVVGVVAVDARQIVEAEVVLLGRPRRPTTPSAARPCSGCRSPHTPVSGPVELDELVERRVRLRMGHRDVAGQDVVERRDVGRALDVGVAAQRQDPAAGPPDVAEQQLDDRRGADVLHADGVLGPADRVARSARSARAPSSRTARAPRRGSPPA